MPLSYRPDRPHDNPGNLITCQHVIPDKNRGYRTSYSASATGWTTALNSECLGSRMTRSSSDARLLWAGTATKLYQLGTSGTVTDLTRTVGGAYSASTSGWWFTQFQDETIACTFSDATQTSNGVANFSALSGAPKARIMLSQKNHLLALCYDDGTVVGNGIKWASEGSTVTWTAATGNSAGNAFLRETPGAIRGGAELHDIVVVWKRTSMYIGQRVGGANIWEFNLLSPYIGILGQEAWVATPVGIIFASNNGIYQFDGSVPKPVDDGIRQEIYRSISSTAEITVMSHDEASGCVFIWTKNSGICWCYCYLTGEWSKAYTGTSLGGSTFTDFKMAVRDTNYEDYRNLGGTANTSRRTHLVFGAEHKLCNLASFSQATGISPSLSVYTVRDPKSGPLDDTSLSRITPIFGYDQESAAFTEPSTGSALISPRTRLGGGQTGKVFTETMSAQKRFDTNAVGNCLAVDLTFTNEKLVISDLAYTTTPIQAPGSP